MTVEPVNRLAWGAYGVAFLLIALPLLDSVLGVWPLRINEATWRFGAVGLFSRAVMTPLLGVLLGLLFAVVAGHSAAARAFSILAFLGVGAALFALGFFALDTLQTRVQIRTEALRAFDTAAGIAVAKYVAGIAVASLLGVGGWRASRGGGGVRRKKELKDGAAGLIWKGTPADITDRSPAQVGEGK